MIQLSHPGLEDVVEDITDHEGTGEPEAQNWACGPFGFWPLTFPWTDGVSWGMTAAGWPASYPMSSGVSTFG